ncbi:MAG: hypothetical protein ACXVEF_20070 [Polyangiales bacterium]
MHLRYALLCLATIAFVAGCPKPNPETTDAGVAPAASSSSPAAKSLWNEKERADAIAAGTAVIEKHQCTRCHTIDQQKAPARPLACTSCHTFLKGIKDGDAEFTKLVARYGEPVLRRYQKNIQHLERVPDLTGLGKRVRADWIAKYLAEPHDLRPLLEESMFRHTMEPAEIQAVARYFAAVADAPDPNAAVTLPSKPSDDALARGKKLFAEKGCTDCHVFGNVGSNLATLEKSKSLALLAPNLRFARERTRPDAIVAWIMDPQKLLPTTTMTKLGISRDDAEAIRDFLFFGDAEVKPLAAIEPTLPKTLDRDVPYEEMKEKVLGKVCVHCHMNDYEKDPGPGNRGGLGYKGVGLRMRTYETLISGAIDEKGNRYSVLVAEKGKTPPILTAMLRRRNEATRDRILPFQDHELASYPKELPGMPLGLPAMDDEATAVLATWIAQGCKGPTKVSGVPGANDGYLVPDGPIEKNAGCELRMPSKTRPAWAKETEAPAKDPKPPASK